MKQAKVLFLCTGNSCRSQMAEGFANALPAGVLKAQSAGTAPGRQVDPRAVQVMGEVGIDISAARPKQVDALEDVAFDVVITVCDHAHETCPVFSGGAVRVLHRGFDDPPRLAADAVSEEEALGHYRLVRDAIGAFVESLPERLQEDGARDE